MTIKQNLAVTEINKREMTAIKRDLKIQTLSLGAFLAIIWAIHTIDYFWTGASFTQYGVRPRTLEGLLGLITAPFLHLNYYHLLANSIAVAMLGWWVMLRDNKDILPVAIISQLVTGLGVWAISAPSPVRVGSGGVIAGFVGYLRTMGIIERKWSSILLMVLAGSLYGGIVSKAIPNFHHYWHGAIFGLFGGVLSAFVIYKYNKLKDYNPPEDFNEGPA